MKLSYSFFLGILLCIGIFLNARPLVWGQQTTRPHLSLGSAGEARIETLAPATLELSTFTIQTESGSIQILSGLRLRNPETVQSQLLDGAVINLSCNLKLVRLRTVLANASVAEAVHSYQLRHDLLTREFILTQQGGPTLRQKDFQLLLKTAWGELHFTLPLTAPLQSGETYRLQLDLTFQHAEVPPWLEKALFFWSWDVCPPVSVTQDFLY